MAKKARHQERLFIIMHSSADGVGGDIIVSGESYDDLLAHKRAGRFMKHAAGWGRELRIWQDLTPRERGVRVVTDALCRCIGSGPGAVPG